MRVSPFRLVSFITASLACLAQRSGPSLSIDAAANRHPISPDIYGINFYWDLGSSTDPKRQAYLNAARDIRATVRRWGGNGASTYHWKFDVNNIAADWFFEVLPDTSVNAAKLPDGSSFNAFADQVRTTGGKIMGTVPLLGWLPRVRAEMCSFDVAKYGKQCKQDPYARYHPITCGNGIAYDPACGDPSVLDGNSPKSPVYLKNDPSDAYAPYDETFQAAWIRYLVTRYGKANQGGINIWSLDNEPIWWDSTHRDIHPDPYTYDEVLDLNLKYAAAIKQAEPAALVSGPVGDNWASLWLSKKDIVAGWARGDYWSNPVDRIAHGGVAFLPWYLRRMRDYERQHGIRLLDYLDMHAYIHPAAIESGGETDAVKALRLESTRRFWDPSYVVTDDYWIRDIENNGAPVAPRYIPRLREIIDQNYPGTRLALTEYNFHALDTLNGALAQADLLGIFGREGLDLATLWGPPKPTDPGAFAFKIFRNYDDIGGAFGETGVLAISADQSQLSIYAALRTDLSLTVIVINKTNSDESSTVSLSNFLPGERAQAWRYSAANLGAIVPLPALDVGGNGFTTVFPANSITLLVIPPATLPAPHPVLNAVTNAASYSQAVAPGQFAVLWGTGMGPDNLAGLALDGNGMVSTSVAGVRVFFDGIPAPIYYVSSKQCSVVVPYFGAAKPTTHVQVEYQGVRSAAIEIPVSATAPGLFTADQSGKGPGAILNEDGVTVNSPAAPARPGSVVVLYGTGEGLTDPPGVDGRPATDVLPKPLAPVSVEIGGLPATIDYAGAAPTFIPGLFQINARVPAAVQPGDNVPVRVTIGNASSQDGVTLAVR